MIITNFEYIYIYIYIYYFFKNLWSKFSINVSKIILNHTYINFQFKI
ncbi:hypothetical protein ACMBCM_05065 [Spiroplasma sp. K1]